MEDLAIFVGVVEATSFSAAARRLGLPKSSVSFRIARLEQRLGARLLERTTRIVRPTELGQLYFERCTRILSEIREADALVQWHTEPTGTLRLAAPIEFGMHILGPVVAAFKRRYPELRIEVELTSRHLDLIEERFDIAVRIGTLSDSSLIVRKVSRIRRGTYVAPGYLARHEPPRHPYDLPRHDCLDFASPYVPRFWTFDPEGTKTGDTKITVDPACSVVINNLTMLRDAAIAGLGITLLPCYLGEEAARAGTLVPTLAGWAPESAEVLVVHPSHRLVPGKVRAFIHHLEDSLPKGIA